LSHRRRIIITAFESRLFGNRWPPQTTCAMRRMLRRSSAVAVATSREGHPLAKIRGLPPSLLVSEADYVQFSLIFC
jgi:hypothetical protein